MFIYLTSKILLCLYWCTAISKLNGPIIKVMSYICVFPTVKKAHNNCIIFFGLQGVGFRSSWEQRVYQ